MSFTIKNKGEVFMAFTLTPDPSSVSLAPTALRTHALMWPPNTPVDTVASLPAASKAGAGSPRGRYSRASSILSLALLGRPIDAQASSSLTLTTRTR